MTQWVKALAMKPEDLSLSPGIHDGKRELTPANCPLTPVYINK